MKKDLKSVDFNITEYSITKTNDIISSMKGNTFHNHYHILYDICNSFKSNKLSYLEIGSYHGGSASLVASNLKVKNVYCLDIGLHNSEQNCNINVNKFKHESCNYTYIKGDSTKVSTINYVKKLISFIDILFIDGDHKYNSVISDFVNYNDLVNSGGYIIFDDYLDSESSPDVRKAVDYIIDNYLENESYQIIGSIIYPELKLTNVSLPTNNLFLVKKI